MVAPVAQPVTAVWAAMAAIILVAGARIQSGAMTIGDFLGIVSAIGVATPAARSLGSFNTLLNEGFAALSRIFTFLDLSAQTVPLSCHPGWAVLLDQNEAQALVK